MEAAGATYGTAFRLKLYPTAAQRQALSRTAGSVRWLWNHLLNLQQETYRATAKFVFRHEMQKLLPALKREEKTAWLAETHVHTLQRVCKALDRALRDSFKAGKGFPRFKARHRSRASFYLSNEAFRLERIADDGRAVGRVRLSKVGSVRFRAGRLPEGEVLGATVSFDGRSWWIAVQCEVGAAVAPGSAPVAAEDAAGCDVGLTSLVTLYDGKSVEKVAAPRRLRKALRRLKRAQKVLSRRRKGSARRHRRTDGEKLGLSERTFRCTGPDCGHVADRDANAAANIRRWGLATLAVHVPHERANNLNDARRAAPGGRARKRAPSAPDPGYGDGRTRNPSARALGQSRESETGAINLG